MGTHTSKTGCTTTVSARVIRANGSVEDLGIIATSKIDDDINGKVEMIPGREETILNKIKRFLGK